MRLRLRRVERLKRTVCLPDPAEPFVVATQRIKKAEMIVREKGKLLGEDTLFEIICQIGFHGAITEGDHKTWYITNLTDLQLIALAAAVQAVAELEGERGVRID